MKNDNEAFALWCAGLFGACGVHRLYLGKTVTGFVWLFTFGLLGFGQVFDLVMLSDWVKSANGVADALPPLANAGSDDGRGDGAPSAYDLVRPLTLGHAA